MHRRTLRHFYQHCPSLFFSLLAMQHFALLAL